MVVVDGRSGHQISYQATEVADAHRQELRDVLHPGSGAARLHKGCGEDGEGVCGPKTKGLDQIVRIPEPLFQPWVQPGEEESVRANSNRDDEIARAWPAFSIAIEDTPYGDPYRDSGKQYLRGPLWRCRQTKVRSQSVCYAHR